MSCRYWQRIFPNCIYFQQNNGDKLGLNCYNIDIELRIHNFVLQRGYDTMKHRAPFRLVVVDDEPTTCDYLSYHIGNAFGNVQVAGHFYNGADAWNFLQTHPVDCLITDIKMPLLSGLDLARLIYENQLATKVIIISGYSDFEYAQQGIKYQVAVPFFVNVLFFTQLFLRMKFRMNTISSVLTPSQIVKLKQICCL